METIKITKKTKTIIDIKSGTRITINGDITLHGIYDDILVIDCNFLLRKDEILTSDANYKLINGELVKQNSHRTMFIQGRDIKNVLTLANVKKFVGNDDYVIFSQWLGDMALSSTVDNVFLEVNGGYIIL